MSENAKSRTVAITLASIPYTGWLGIDRFYLGRYFTGILKLLLSLFAIGGVIFTSYHDGFIGANIFRIIMLPFMLGMFAWYITDIVLTCSHTATDKWGRPLQRRQPVLYGAPVYPAPPAAFRNGGFDPNQVYHQVNAGEGQPAISKKKNPLLLAGLIVGSIIVFMVFIAFVVYLLNSMGVKNKLVLHELTIEYPIMGWMQEHKTDSDSVSIAKGETRLALKFSKSDIYIRTSALVDECIRNYKDTMDDFNLHGEIQDITINHASWIKFEFSATVNGELRKGMQLFHSTDYEIYSMTYTANEKDYDQYLDEVIKITESASLPPKETNTLSVKQQILGEWDCGKTGYFIINTDNTYYFYKDSSKSSDNVVYGTYEATDGIATYAAGYAEGITFTATIRKTTIDGINQPAAVNSQIAYVLVPDGTGNFTGNNLNTGGTFEMIRVK